MSEVCLYCGEDRTHYLTHVCAGCTCHITEVRIPGEPHIPAMLEAEMDPDCVRHGDCPSPQTSTQPPRVEAEDAVSAETRPGRDSARPAAVGGESDE